MFSEVTEVRDAIHLLTPRAANADVARDLIREMAWYDEYLQQGSADRSANPTPGNKRGGLSNIVEKALGSIAKSGTTTIQSVVPPGERVRTKGLVFAATPASDFICGTHKCNLQVGRCAFPCANAATDCAAGMSCLSGLCVPGGGQQPPPPQPPPPQ